MHHFQYRNGDLYCEEVRISDIAEAVATPFYLYSHATLTRHFRVFDEAFSRVPHIVCFSAKSNSNISILSTFGKLGSGADVVSGGELYRALQANIEPKRIVFSGVGKTRSEMEFALEVGILMFNVESEGEIMVLNNCAFKLNLKAPLSLRVNPDVDPKTHPYIVTGLRKNKFGVEGRDALRLYLLAKDLPNIEIVGIDCHIGSQVTEIEPFVDALIHLKELISELEGKGIELKYIDLGGGLGITYDQEEPPHPNIYAENIIDHLKGLSHTLILEPGRVIVGNAGILVTKVLYTKRHQEKNFVIVDAGMNDLIRPSLYGSYHAIQPVEKKDRDKIVADVVGPICESGDFLAKDRIIPEVKPGELLAVMSTGAYGFAMASNYNSRRRSAEILVKGDKFFVIREREEYQDLIRGESIPPFLL